MKKITKVLLIIIVVLVVALALVTKMYFDMKDVAKQNLEGLLNSTEDVWRLNIKMDESQTFYAVIESISEDNVVKVQGLSVNDVNYRGEFIFTIKDFTEVKLRFDNIDPQELKVGDIIAVTFDGAILETSPAGISDVSKIQLLVYEDNENLEINNAENIENTDLNEVANEETTLEENKENLENVQNIDTTLVEDNK